MKLEKHKTACGGTIIIPVSVQKHLLAHLDVVAHLPEAISKIRLPRDQSKIELEVEMGRVIGRGGIVATSDLSVHDRALFAVRANRKFSSHVTPPGVVGADSTSVVVIAKPARILGQYQLVTAWIGVRARKEPWDPNIADNEEFEECLRFWNAHALVYDPLTMGPLVESSWDEILTASQGRGATLMGTANYSLSSNCPLQLIGGEKLDFSVSERASWRSAPETQAQSTAEAERLRHAILCQVVEELGQTVDEMLREINEKVDSEEFEDHCRCGQITLQLGRRGLMYMLAPSHVDLDCNGYLLLNNVQRFLAGFPELSPMSPEKYLYLTIGELPPLFQHAVSTPQQGGNVLPFRRPQPRADAVGSTAIGHFDVPENSRWGKESNRLRHSILTLQLRETGCSVKQALATLCLGIGTKAGEKYYRAIELKHHLETRLGLRFQEAVDMPVEGYLVLAWPDRLLRNYPQFAGLHALTWHSLRIA